MLKRAKNRKSKVELLPEDIRASIGALIRSGDMTQKDILAAINEMIDEAGLPEDAKISRTSFNRYAQRMEKNGARIREAREVAEVWATKLGDAPASELGKHLQDVVRTLAFETGMHMMEGDKPATPKALGEFALLLQRVESAAMKSHKLEKEIRDALLEEQKGKLNALKGVTQKTKNLIREELGI